MKPKILFPTTSEIFLTVDSCFVDEKAAAEKVGFNTALLASEIFFDGDIRTKNVDQHNWVMYRGWILKNNLYRKLNNELLNKNCTLFQSVEDYEFSRDFPSWYHSLQGITPKSWWYHQPNSKEIDINLVQGIVKNIFGDTPLIVKDFVKSRKQDWHDACYIPNVDNIERVVKNFIELQGEEFVGGLVFKEFVQFKNIGTHPKSKMPLINEWRQFYYGDKLVYQAPYWADGADYENCAKPPAFNETMKKLNCGFTALDVAEKEDGSWLIVELNDGGTAGIPDGGSLSEFYEALKDV